MKKYGVVVPVAGNIYKEVEADSKEEALDIVFEEGFEYEDIEELEMCDRLVKGNTIKVYAEEIEEEDCLKCKSNKENACVDCCKD